MATTPPLHGILLTGDTSATVIFTDLAPIFDNVMRPQLTERHIYLNDTPTFNFIINENGPAKNLTGLSLEFSAKIAPSPNSTFIFNATPTITDATNGLATITLPQTATTPAGNYIAEVSLWGPGYKQVAIQFPLVIDPIVS